MSRIRSLVAAGALTAASVAVPIAVAPAASASTTAETAAQQICDGYTTLFLHYLGKSYNATWEGDKVFYQGLAMQVQAETPSWC